MHCNIVVFPFRFLLSSCEIHNDCNWDGDSSGGAWCSTLISDSGQHVGGKGNWGNCAENCPMYGESKSGSSQFLVYHTTNINKSQMYRKHVPQNQSLLLYRYD